MTNTILILSVPEDEHASEVAKPLERRGASCVWLDPSAAVAASKLAFTLQGGIGRCSLGAVEMGDVKVAWYRRPTNQPTPSALLPSAQLKTLAAAECALLARDLLGSMQCDWVPAPYHVLRGADQKLTQLVKATAVGFETPPTLVTSDSSKLWDFYREHDGRLISKLANNEFFRVVKKHMRYTNRVTLSDMANAESMRLSPLIVQAEIPKEIEIRATVIGEAVFAVGIHSQATRRTGGDWRRYTFGRSGTPHDVHRLPAEVEARCVRLTKDLGLNFAAIDLVLTPDGRYVFLESNPNGQWLWLELLTKLPITEAVADHLIELASRNEGPKS